MVKSMETFSVFKKSARSGVTGGLLLLTLSIICWSPTKNIVLAQSQSSQTPQWQMDAGSKMSFDVASIKRNTSGLPPSGPAPYSNIPLFAGDVFPPNGGRLSIINLPAPNLIAFAYKLGSKDVASLSPQLPKWALTERFDVEAEAPPNTTKDQMRLMMQSLLADRFSFAMHYDVKQESVYALSFVKQGKMGPQLRLYKSTEEPCPTPPGATPIGSNSTEGLATVSGGFPATCGGIQPLIARSPSMHRIGSRDISMRLFASAFTGDATGIDKPIVDETGISQPIDFILEYWRITNPIPINPPGPTFIEAIKEQLGLKLEPQKALVTAFVVDHIQEPSAN